MPSPVTLPTRSYHHGDLRNALVEAGVHLAREGGPQAIVLREAARRVGVSPNAAYRHFDDLPELVEAVAREALRQLGSAIQRELARCRPTGRAGDDAWGQLQATGRGYVHFALDEPGLFATAFDRHDKLTPPPSEDDCDPWLLLTAALHRLVAAGLLEGDKVEAAQLTAWSTVHGLSVLLLGPRAGLSRAERERVIDATLRQIGSGILSR